jgi:hypothetical protein
VGGEFAHRIRQRTRWSPPPESCHHMQQAKKDFLSLTVQPARLNITEAAWFLGFGEDDIAVLIAAGLLKPLGRPPASGSKYFATAELQVLRNDTRWLARASDAIVIHWKRKNASRRLAVDSNPR